MSASRAVAAPVVAIVLTLALGHLPATALATTDADPARCARTIAKTGAGLVRKQLAGFGGCLDRTLQCLEMKPGDHDCLARRRATCTRTVHRLAKAERAAVRAIVGTCEPASAAMLDDAGLGYALVADRCAALGAPLSDARTIADCVVRAHRCGAMGILAAQEPRAAAILASAGVDDAAIACLEHRAAASTRASLATDESFACGSAARRAGRAFALTRLQKLGTCARAVSACADGASDRAVCVATARRTCDRAVAVLPSSVLRFGRSVDRACPELAVRTDAEAACTLPNGGGGRPSAAASCLLQRDGCLVDELLRFESPRGAALSSEMGIDARGTLCAAADSTAPTPAPTAAGEPIETSPITTAQVPARTPTRTPTPRRTPTRTATRTRSPTPTLTSTPAIVQALAIDPSGTILRAGTNGGGIFASTSGGDSWTPSSTGLTTLDVTVIADDPRTPEVVFAGTDGGGVFTSTSGGASWTASNAGLANLRIRTLAIDPATPAILLVGTAGSGVFRSDSAGASWTAVSAGLANRDVSALAIDSAVTTNVYAGTVGSGVFKSSDGGINWTRTSLADSFARAAVVRSLAIDPVTTNVIYAGSNEGGVFKSTDGGDTWTITSLFSAFPNAASVRVVALDPLTPTTIYAGTIGGVFVSRDAGATWTPTSLAGSFPNSTSVRALVIDPRSPRTLYVGTLRGGVFKSTDGGLTWSPARSGLPVG